MKRYKKLIHTILTPKDDILFNHFREEVYQTLDSLDSGSAWNENHMIMGVFHFWVDSSGNLRVKRGVPTAESDGTIVVNVP
jgi:hypothetical protein